MFSIGSFIVTKPQIIIDMFSYILKSSLGLVGKPIIYIYNP